MAERIQVELVDDIDGSVAQQTVTFALDGVAYEIDLSEQHARELRSVFARYIEHAQKPERSSRQTKRQEREERQAKQANRQLTEQIRGAAQRSRDLLKERENTAATEESAEGEITVEATAKVESAGEPEAVGSETISRETVGTEAVGVHSAEETGDSERQSSAVSLPQFSAAVD